MAKNNNSFRRENNMSGSVNKAIIIGRLGREPEMRRTPGGDAVTTLNIATTERFNDKNGNRQEKTEWHNVVLWKKNAENAGQYLKKGSSVYIEGKLETRSWDDNGTTRYRTEIKGHVMQFLDSRGGGDGQQQGGGFDDGGFGGGQQQQQPQQGYQQPQYQQPQQQLPVEDDLPF
jgi:single-strand DNA-binding protein